MFNNETKRCAFPRIDNDINISKTSYTNIKNALLLHEQNIIAIQQLLYRTNDSTVTQIVDKLVNSYKDIYMLVNTLNSLSGIDSSHAFNMRTSHNQPSSTTHHNFQNSNSNEDIHLVLKSGILNSLSKEEIIKVLLNATYIEQIVSKLKDGQKETIIYQESLEDKVNSLLMCADNRLNHINTIQHKSSLENTSSYKDLDFIQTSTKQLPSITSSQQPNTGTLVSNNNITSTNDIESKLNAILCRNEDTNNNTVTLSSDKKDMIQFSSKNYVSPNKNTIISW